MSTPYSVMRVKGTPLLRVDVDCPRPSDVRWAAAVIKNGGVITLPTDTVYGLAADPFNPVAVERLFRLKGRDDGKPIACLLSDVGRANGLAAELSADFKRLAKAHWPGALTLIVRRGSKAPALLARGRKSLGLRVPDSPWARALARHLGGMVAATSANRTGKPPALSGREAAGDFGGRVELLVDGGSCPGTMASAVVDCGGRRMKLLRKGALDLFRK